MEKQQVSHEEEEKELKDSEKQEEEPPPRPPLVPSCRFTLSILCFFATFNMIVTRLNFSFALVCMVKTGQLITNLTDNATSMNLTSISGDDSCRPLPRVNRSGEWNIEEEGEFEWSKELQGHLLGAFFYGYMVSQPVGGWLSDRFGGKRLLLVGTAAASLLAMSSPAAARTTPMLLFALRLLQGLAQGFTHPTIMVLFGRWTGPLERAFCLSIAYAGFNVGNAVIFPLSGLLCQYGFDGGWPSVFHVTGIIGIVWCVGTWFLVYDSPEQHPRISGAELKYLQHFSAVHGKDYNRKDHRVPWLAILKSVPVHAFIITHLFLRWGFHTLQLNLPTFMKEALYLDINENGFLSGAPFVGTLVSHLLIGKLFDHLRKKNLCSLTWLRKIFNTIGLVCPAISLIVIAFLTCHQKYWAIAILAMGQIMAEFSFVGGYFFSIIDMAPRLSGLLTGIANSISVATGFLCPAAVAAMTSNRTRAEWMNVFYLAAGTYFLAAAVYLLFGSSERQPWAKEEESKVQNAESAETVTMLDKKFNPEENSVDADL